MEAAKHNFIKRVLEKKKSGRKETRGIRKPKQEAARN
jgi:hypothetical protein